VRRISSIRLRLIATPWCSFRWAARRSRVHDAKGVRRQII
jgi:hypothetical protein